MVFPFVIEMKKFQNQRDTRTDKIISKWKLVGFQEIDVNALNYFFTDRSNENIIITQNLENHLCI